MTNLEILLYSLAAIVAYLLAIHFFILIIGENKGKSYSKFRPMDISMFWISVSFHWSSFLIWSWQQEERVSMTWMSIAIDIDEGGKKHLCIILGPLSMLISRQ